MVIVPKCRTEAVLALGFPIVAALCKYLQVKRDKTLFKKISLWILILSPILCLMITIILGEMREWLVVHTFGTYVENFSKRFIQSGLAFKEHGFPIFGEQLRYNSGLSEQLGEFTFILYKMDNAYSTYIILRGMIWMVPALIWLCYSNWRAVKNRDYALITISVLFCLLGLMERYGLDAFNVSFYYPLAISAISTGNSRNTDIIAVHRGQMVEETEASS